MLIFPTGTASIRVPAHTIPALAAFLFGLMLFVATGFAWPAALHNAMHDTRHSLGLPCH
jgi:cobalt transporter subunit CbtB